MVWPKQVRKVLIDDRSKLLTKSIWQTAANYQKNSALRGQAINLDVLNQIQL